MPFKMIVRHPGGPEVMQWEQAPAEMPGPGQATVRHRAIGLNFVDTYFRSGLYPLPTPFVPGACAAGVVESVAPGVGNVRAGDRVAYAGSTGAYAEQRAIDASVLVRLPDDIDDSVAASCLLQGLTARFLVKQVYPVRAGEFVLVHAAAGGVGSLLCQWASGLGAIVIGTVSTRDKAQLALANGCRDVVVHGEADFVQRVAELTSGRKLGVVFDSVGKDTFARSLDCLWRRGTMVVFGQSSGVIEPLEINLLARKGSLVLTRPALPDFIATPTELAAASEDLFDAFRRGLLRAGDIHERPITEAAQAHRDLEARRTAGHTVFTL